MPDHNQTIAMLSIPESIADTIKVFVDAVPATAITSTGAFDPKDAHVTLAFLGETNDAYIVSTLKRVRKAVGNFPPFTATIRGTTRFPSHGQGSILVGNVESPYLTQMHYALRKEFSEVENRFQFNPHVTLAYLKPKVNTQFAGSLYVKWPVDEVVVSTGSDRKFRVTLTGSRVPIE